MLALCEQVGEQICTDYLLSSDEAKQLIDHMALTLNQKFLRSIYASGKTNEQRASWCYQQFDDFAYQLVLKRPLVKLPDDDELERIIWQSLNVALLPHNND